MMPQRLLRRAALGLTLLAASAAGAQTTPRAIHGVVRAEHGTPLEMAEVLVFGTQISARSDDAGKFRLEKVPPGKYFVGVRRLGYAPVVFTLTLEAGKDRDVDIELEPLPTTLSPVKIKARSDFNLLRYGDLMWRRRTAWGDFITRDDIEREHPYSLASMVARYLPGVSPQMLERSSDLFYTSGNRSGWSLRPCAPALSVNGTPPLPGWTLADFAPEAVEAVEIYRGRIARVPVEFQGSNSACGVVVLWTR